MHEYDHEHVTGCCLCSSQGPGQEQERHIPESNGSKEHAVGRQMPRRLPRYVPVQHHAPKNQLAPRVAQELRAQQDDHPQQRDRPPKKMRYAVPRHPAQHAAGWRAFSCTFAFRQRAGCLQGRGGQQRSADGAGLAGAGQCAGLARQGERQRSHQVRDSWSASRLV
jgi:hypothetical protein